MIWIFSALLVFNQAPSGQIRDVETLRYEILVEEVSEAKEEAAEAQQAAEDAQDVADEAMEFVDSAQTIIALVGYLGGPGVILTAILSYLGYKRFSTRNEVG